MLEENEFKINVALYLSLYKYKRYFAEAINIYFTKAVGMYSCDYIPLIKGKIEDKKTVQLKVEHEPLYFKEIFEFIEKQELEILNEGREEKEKINKLNRTTLINNIMSTLIGIEQFNHEKQKEKNYEK